MVILDCLLIVTALDSPNWHGPYSIRPRCIAGRYVHEYAFDYVKDALNNYRGRSKVVFAQLLEGTQRHNSSNISNDNSEPR